MATNYSVQKDWGLKYRQCQISLSDYSLTHIHIHTLLSLLTDVFASPSLFSAGICFSVGNSRSETTELQTQSLTNKYKVLLSKN